MGVMDGGEGLRYNFRYIYFVTAYLPLRVEGRAICAPIRLLLHRGILNLYYCQVLWCNILLFITTMILFRNVIHLCLSMGNITTCLSILKTSGG